MQILKYVVAGLVNTPFTNVSRTAIAQKSSKCMEIIPFNLQMFNDLDFISSGVTNIPHHQEQNRYSSTNDNQL